MSQEHSQRTSRTLPRVTSCLVLFQHPVLVGVPLYSTDSQSPNVKESFTDPGNGISERGNCSARRGMAQVGRSVLSYPIPICYGSHHCVLSLCKEMWLAGAVDFNVYTFQFPINLIKTINF